MPQRDAMSRVQDAIVEDEVAAIAADLIRIPSHRWEEGEAASYAAGFMRGAGLHVVVQRVDEGEVHSKQAIGRLRGTGGGPSLLLCGHLDTSTSPPARRPYRLDRWTRDPFGGHVEDGVIYGLGATNMKGADAAMLAAVRALARADTRLRGDVILALVMGETANGLGIEYALKHGLAADQAIVAESTDFEIVTTAISACRGHIHVEGRAPFDAARKSAPQLAADLVAAVGPPYEAIAADGWLPHTPNPELPGYPRISIKEIQTYDDEFCRLTFDCALIPGLAPTDVQHGLEGLLRRLDIRGRIEIPPHPHMRHRPTPAGIARDHPLVLALGRSHEAEFNRPAVVSASKRLGGGSDASNLLAAGVPTVVYGPGSMVNWPAPLIDEHCRTGDLAAAARIFARTALALTS